MKNLNMLVSNEDMASLRRFTECCGDLDADGHDVPSDAMKRLEKIGLVRSLGFGRHEMTDFGDAIIAALPAMDAVCAKPANQQLLAEVVELLECHQKWINKLPVPTTGATHQMMHVVGKAIDALNGMKSAPITPKRSLQEGEIDNEWHAHGGKVTGNGTCFVIGKWDYHKLRRNIATTEAAQPVVQPAQMFTTSEAGRKYVADFFTNTLRRHDFTRYINERIAADFACVLGSALSSMQPAYVPLELDSSNAPWMPAETEPDLAYADGWNACRRAILAAAPKPEGGA